MISQPDKLFRDKLENFQQLAPAAAWERIENNLARPVHKLMWVRIAAGVALLTAAALALWPSEKPEPEIAKTHVENQKIKNNPAQHPDKKDDVKNEVRILEPVSPKHTNTITLVKTQNQLPIQKTTAVEDSVMKLINPILEINELVAQTVQPEESASQKIVYTAGEVNAKFLKKKLPPEATANSKDASGIQKLIGLAYAAKNSEAGLGELRQKKDDLLALNFGKKKGEN